MTRKKKPAAKKLPRRVQYDAEGVILPPLRPLEGDLVGDAERRQKLDQISELIRLYEIHKGKLPPEGRAHADKLYARAAEYLAERREKETLAVVHRLSFEAEIAALGGLPALKQLHQAVKVLGKSLGELIRDAEKLEAMKVKPTAPSRKRKKK